MHSDREISGLQLIHNVYQHRMKLNKLFWIARRFNTLIPIGIAFIILCFCLWGLYEVVTSPKATKTTISETETNGLIREQGTVFELESDSIGKSDQLVLKLVAKKLNGRGYEDRYKYGTRNLLIINERSGESTWLFETPLQKITSKEMLVNSKGEELGFLLTTFKLKNVEEEDEEESTRHTKQEVYFASLNLKSKHLVLEGIEHVLKTRQLDTNWSVVYKKGMEIHHALYSLNEHKVLSDKVVANLEPVK